MVALMVEDESPTTFARLIKQRLLAPHVVPGHHVVSHAVGRVHVIARRHHIRDKTDRPLRIIKLDRLQSPGMSRTQGEANIPEYRRIAVHEFCLP